MKIGRIARLRLAYAFWRAIGCKKRNSVMAIIHEGGFVDIAAWNLSGVAVDELQKARGPADACYERYQRLRP